MTTRRAAAPRPAGARPSAGLRRPGLALVLVLAIAAGLAGMAGPAGAANGLFGSMEFSSTNLAAIPQWVSVMARIRNERATIQSCDHDAGTCPTPRVQTWRRHTDGLAGLSAAAQADAVNRYVNSIVPYITDYENYGVSDYWAAPLEFLRRSGDCEDYAITKFVSMLDLGHSNASMRIVVVNDVVRNIAHAVLSVDVGDRTLILDSLISSVTDDTRLPQYIPQYSVNLDTRWAHIMR